MLIESSYRDRMGDDCFRCGWLASWGDDYMAYADVIGMWINEWDNFCQQEWHTHLEAYTELREYTKTFVVLHPSCLGHFAMIGGRDIRIATPECTVSFLIQDTSPLGPLNAD